MKELIYTAHKVVASASFVHGGATKTFTYNYPAGTNLLASLACPSNLTIEHAYEAGRDLLAGITIRRGASTDVVLRNYTYDTLGRPFTRSTSRNGTTQNDNFGYNSRSELTSATLGDDSYAYAFDHIGNRNTASEAGTQSAYSTNNLNQYTEISLGETETSPLQYDTDGNVTSVQTSTGTWGITYNGENRPVRFENAETQTVVECAYDSQGRRFEKEVTVAGATTLHHRYIYRGYLQIAALDLTRSAHPALWLVTWDPSQPTATRPLAIQKDGTWFTYGYDITKNICEVFGPAGYIRTAYSYAPFGAVTESGDVSQPFQWSSEVYDSELDLVYYNYRHYSPSLGRFLSRDSIEEQGGLNLYAFVGNNAILHQDYIGKKIPLINQNFESLYEGREVVGMGDERLFGKYARFVTDVRAKNIEVRLVLHEKRFFGADRYKLVANFKEGPAVRFYLYWISDTLPNAEQRSLYAHEKHHFDEARSLYNNAFKSINKYDGVIVCGKNCKSEYSSFKNATIQYADTAYRYDVARFHLSREGGYTDTMLNEELPKYFPSRRPELPVRANYGLWGEELKSKAEEEKKKSTDAESKLKTCIGKYRSK